MAKIRTVKPEFFRHELLFETEQQYRLPLRLAFIGLFSCCDREGRFRWEARSLKLDILPYDEVDFSQILNALWAAGFIKKYVCQNKYYGFIPSWHQHQCINKHEPVSKLPNPEKCDHESYVEIVSKVLDVEVPAKHESISAIHKPISDMHMHARALHESVSALSSIEKDTNESHGIALNTALHMHTYAMHVPLSAMHEPVSACLPNVENQISSCENNTNSSQPIDAINPVQQRISIDSEPKNFLGASMPLSDMHMHARALHEDVCATHNDASAAHVLAPLEVEMEVEMEVEVEVEVEMEVEKEVEKEVKMKQSLGANRNIVAPARRCSITLAQISTVFNHWKITLQHPDAVLDKKRHKLIQQALQQGYTVPQLCDAISGCGQTPHNIGDNEQGQRYDGLHIIFGGSDQIERFIRNYHNPPRPRNPTHKLLQTNIATGKNWLERKKTEIDLDEK